MTTSPFCRTFRFLAAAVLLLITASAVLADNLTLPVTISHIDKDKRVLTVTRKTASGPKTITLDVSDGAKIESEGKTVTLGDLEPGQAATITYNTDLEIITGISADKFAPGAGFEPLFDGKTLDGWAGDRRYWKVEKGVIVGKNPDNSGEQFLRTTKTFDNFVLRLKFRHITGNSGVNFRSHTVPGGFLTGPQAEITDLRLPKLHIAYGVLYDNRGGRGVIADVDPKLKSRLIASVRKTDWSEYEITVNGNHISIILNGITAIDVDDDQMAPSGVIGFQLHPAVGTHVEFKDIEIRSLPKSE